MVIGRFVTRQVDQTIQITLESGVTLEGTPVHPIWSPEHADWVPMGDFEAGDHVLTRTGIEIIQSVESKNRPVSVYNLEVHGEHVYEVTESGVLVHNICPSGIGAQNSVPQVSNSKLKNYVDNLYKGAKGPNPIGTGSTADAVRNELRTGLPTHGRFHSQKAQETITGLTNWLRNNPNASHHDRLVAQSLLDDLKAALAGN